MQRDAMAERQAAEQGKDLQDVILIRLFMIFVLFILKQTSFILTHIITSLKF